MPSALKSSWRSYAVAMALPRIATALLLSIPTATVGPHGHLLSDGPQPTASFDDNKFHAAVRRQAGNPQTPPASLSTSFGPASLCGWIDGDAGGDVYCNNNEKCVFHPPNTAFGGMGGCCPNNNDHQCGFESTCYDAAAVSATPDLLSTRDPFAMYCTDTDGAYCVTWFYTQLGISDYGCGTESVYQTVLTDATVTPTVTGVDPYVMMVSVSYVPDDLLSTYADLVTTASSDLGKVTTSPIPSSTTTPTTSGSVTTSAGNTPPPTTSAASSSGSSTPVGAIVGGVVGGVVGLGAIAGACFMFWLWTKKKKENSLVEMSAQNTNGPGGYQSVPQYQGQNQGWDNSTVSEAGGSGINKGSAGFYAPPSNPGQYAPVEIDSRHPDVVAELPVSNISGHP